MVALPPVVVTDFVVGVVVVGAGAGITTVRDAGAGAIDVDDGGGDGALRWITIVRCFTMGFKGLDGFTEVFWHATGHRQFGSAYVPADRVSARAYASFAEATVITVPAEAVASRQ